MAKFAEAITRLRARYPDDPDILLVCNFEDRVDKLCKNIKAIVEDININTQVNQERIRLYKEVLARSD